MSLLDFILLAPICFGIVSGTYRGFFRELVVVSCVVVALFVSRYFGEFIAKSISEILGWNINITKPISFIVIFISAIIGLKILAGIFTKISEAMTLSWLNRILGGMLGGFKWLLITSVAVNMLSFFYRTTQCEDKNRLAQSRFYRPIEATLSTIVPFLRFEHFTDKIDNITDKPQNRISTTNI